MVNNNPLTARLYSKRNFQKKERGIIAPLP